MLNKNKPTNTAFSISSRLILALFLFGSLLIINAFINNFSLRLDFTKNKIFTLTDYSRELAKSVDDIVSIKVYFSKKLPPQVNQLRKHVRDLLKEYEIYSRHNISVEFIDPGDDPEQANRMRQLGIPQIQMNVRERDKLEVVAGYLGIGIYFEDRIEILPVVKDMSSLEYDITVAIKKLINQEIKTLGIMPFDQSLEETYSNLKEQLEKNYTVQELDGSKVIPSAIDTLLVMGPEDVSGNTLFYIDQYLMQNKNIVFLIDRIKLENGLMAKLMNSGFEDMLRHHGIQVEPSLVADSSHEYAAFSSGYFTFTIPYPFWPKLTNSNFLNNPALAKIGSIVLPWASPVTFSEVNTENMTQQTLVTSSKQAYEQKNNLNLNPRQDFSQQFRIQPLKTFNMIGLVSGKFNSFYEKNLPPEGLSLTENSPKFSTRSNVLVMGNSAFVNDKFAKMFPSNMTLFLNVIDWLTIDSNLIDIRSRMQYDYPLKEIPHNTQLLIKIIATGTFPVILVTFGLLMYIKRKKRKKEGISL